MAANSEPTAQPLPHATSDHHISLPLLLLPLTTTGDGVGAGCLRGPIPAAAVTWLRKILQASTDCCSPELFGAAPDGLNPRTASGMPGDTPSAVGSKTAAAAAGSHASPVTPGSFSTPQAAAAKAGAAAVVTPRNSIARLISGKRGSMLSSPGIASPGNLLGPDGVPVGSLFALADKLSQAASAALSTARTAFSVAADEEGKVSGKVVIHHRVGGGCEVLSLVLTLAFLSTNAPLQLLIPPAAAAARDFVVPCHLLSACVCACSPLQLLPGGARALYELWADLGQLLLEGGPGERMTHSTAQHGALQLSDNTLARPLEAT